MDTRLELRFDAAWARKKKRGKKVGEIVSFPYSIERCDGGATRLTLVMFDVRCSFRLCSSAATPSQN